MDILGYIDPASGAMMLQILVAGVLSVGIVFRQIIFAPIAFVKRLFQTPQPCEKPVHEKK